MEPWLLDKFNMWDFGGPTGDCWEWQGTLNKKINGYGLVSHAGKQSLTHRLMYQLTHPNEDISRLIIRHKCDNPKCCNPTHLESGTAQDNSNDAKRRGRIAKGERGSKAKLTDKEALSIYKQFHDETCRITQRELAESYGVSQVAISNICRGKRYVVHS